MVFACVHIPDFLLQAVVRSERALCGRALALLDGTPPQCRVVAANEAAIRAGIEIGMAKAQAEQFGGVVEIRRRSHEQEKNAHAALLDLGASFSPRVEDTAPESILLDLAGLETLFGSAQSVAQRLAQGALEMGLVARVAVASNPDAALHAARGTALVTVIPEGEEAARLGALPVSVLDPPTEVLQTLHRWGVRTCAALAALPVLDLSERLGVEGVRLHEWARGAGQRSLVLAEAAIDFEESLELDYEVTELEPLAFLLSRLLEALCARLAARSLAVSTLHLKLKLTAQPSSGSDDQPDRFVIPSETPARRSLGGGGRNPSCFRLLRLPVPMRNTRLLLNLLRLQLQGDPPSAPVCGVYLAAEPARPRATQGGFFVPSGPDPQTLELTLARLAHLVGEARVGSPQILDTHRPDAFRMCRFIASEDKRNVPDSLNEGEKSQKPQVAHKTGRPELQKNGGHTMHHAGLRVLRPAVAVRVEMHAGRPARVFFRGMRGEVVTASGPWRSSGEWWDKDVWQQDEWDLEIYFAIGVKAAYPELTPPSNVLRKTGLYRFAYDESRRIWQVRGVFD